MEFKLNQWNFIGNSSNEDLEFMKVRKGGNETVVSYILYTPINQTSNCKVPIVQSVNMELQNDKISDVITEFDVNNIVLEAITQMNKTGTIYNVKTEEDVENLLSYLGVSKLVFNI